VKEAKHEVKEARKAKKAEKAKKLETELDQQRIFLVNLGLHFSFLLLRAFFICLFLYTR